MHRKLTSAAVAAGVVLALAACSSSSTPSETPPTTADGSSPEATQAEAKPLVIYTARAEEITDYVVDAFTQEHPEYEGKISILAMGAADIVNRVTAEQANPQASLWWGGTAQAFTNATTAGLLEAWPDAPFADQIAAEYKDPEGHWYAEYQLPQVIVYNTEVLDETTAPQDWDDLVKPEWKDKIVIRDVAPSGGMRTIFTSRILESSPDGSDPEPGFDWLRQLDANTVTYAADPTDLYLQLSRQNGVVTLWNLQDTLIQVQQNDMPFGFLVPASGTPVIIDGLGIVKGAPNPEGAELFAEFLYDQGVRTTLADEYFQIPVTEIAEEPAWLDGLDIEPMDIDWGVAAAHETEWIDFWANNIKNQN